MSMIPVWLVVSTRAAVLTLVCDHFLRATETSFQLHESDTVRLMETVKLPLFTNTFLLC